MTQHFDGKSQNLAIFGYKQKITPSNHYETERVAKQHKMIHRDSNQ